MKQLFRYLALGAALLAAALSGCADVPRQASDAVGAILRPSAQSALAEPSAARPGSVAAAGRTNPALKASPQAEQELLPDRTCTRPLEKFDITAKAIEYAGTEAQLRLKRFTDSDFKYSDLTPADRKFLNYLALTTIWVPQSVETSIVRAYSMVAGSKVALLPMQRGARDEMEARLKTFQSQVVGFPGDIRFEVDGTVSDGAFAQLGSLITTSSNFLGLMEANSSARDLVLAHELSHVYKRHRLKQLQVRMVTAAAGFEIAKKLMEMAQGQSASNPIASMAFLAVNGPALIEFVRQADLKFSNEQELEADACAAVWLQRAQVDRCDAWRGFVKIAPTDGAYVDTHPTNAMREENYFRRLDGVSCQSGTASVSNARTPREVVPPALAPAGGRRRAAPLPATR